MLSITFVVPCLNEQGNLEKTVATIDKAATDCGIETSELIIVDDGSTDGTLAVARRIADERKDTVVVAHPRNFGLGAAYKTGLRAATREHVMLVPGDDVWPATELAKIIRLTGTADIVVPYIVVARDKGLVRRFVSRLFTGTVNFIFGQDIPYYNGVVIHRTDLIRNVTISSDDFAYQVEGLIKVLGRGASHVNVATETSERPSGHSKALRLTNIARVMMTLLRLIYEVRITPLFRRLAIAVSGSERP